MLNEILKNKDIHTYYKRDEKRWFYLQNVVLKATILLPQNWPKFVFWQKKELGDLDKTPHG